MKDPVVVEFTYSRDEYVRAIRRHYKTALNLRRDVITGIAGTIGGLYAAFALNVAWVGWILFAAGAVLLGIVTFMACGLPRMIYNMQPMLKNRFYISFSDDCIRFKTDGIDSTLQWSVYHSWVSDAEFYVIYHGKRELTVIPRRVLAAGDMDGRLRELLVRKFDPRPFPNHKEAV